MGFATETVTKANFVATYIKLCTSGADPQTIGKWLIEYAFKMSERMFEDPSNDWLSLSVEQILALRAVAPEYVFTSAARSDYLNRVSGDEDRMAYVRVMFSPGSDFDLVTQLPGEKRRYILGLMQVAYRKAIRNADPRVRTLTQ